MLSYSKTKQKERKKTFLIVKIRVSVLHTRESIERERYRTDQS